MAALVKGIRPVMILQHTSLNKLYQRAQRMMHHPGRIWLCTWRTINGLHLRVVDCEKGEYDGYQTFLSWNDKNQRWSGHMRNGDSHFTFNDRQAQAMFEGMFDWLSYWIEK